MNLKFKNWFLDFCEKSQTWHHDLERVPENAAWKNIGTGNKLVINHFCDMIDMMRREFGLKFTTAQIIRMAECTPGLTIYSATPRPKDPDAAELHMMPICSREDIERHTSWEPVED